MNVNIPDLYAKRVEGTLSVICMNREYTISEGAVYEGPATEQFSWDIYHTP